ncbi:hypothetical protein ACIB24_09305 [Spongisporangium articulatum]|uniref:Cox cluster protein n=1 Tax=Spongisporangium articulatum TaxID=3362603 RepID=A0ABW8AMS2_9ACTN
MSDYIDFDALGQALLFSLVAGVGLVVFFALGMVGWSLYEGRVDDVGPGETVTVASKPAGLALSVVSFAVVLSGVAIGIFAIFDKG